MISKPATILQFLKSSGKKDLFWKFVFLYARTLRQDFSLQKYVCTLVDSGFFKTFLYQGGVKSTVSWVFEDPKFKISEGYKQNLSFPVSANRVETGKLLF